MKSHDYIFVSFPAPGYLPALTCRHVEKGPFFPDLLWHLPWMVVHRQRSFLPLLHSAMSIWDPSMLELLPPMVPSLLGHLTVIAIFGQATPKASHRPQDGPDWDTTPAPPPPPRMALPGMLLPFLGQPHLGSPPPHIPGEPYLGCSLHTPGWADLGSSLHPPEEPQT